MSKSMRELSYSSSPSTPARGATAMVASAHPLASQAGIEVLQRGGNAFDAAVAVASAIGAAEPMMSGAGGLGWAMLYRADERQARYLDFSGRLPQSLDPTPFRTETPGWERSRSLAKAVLVPGNMAGWFHWHRWGGRLPWKELFEPALNIARDGHVVSPFLAKFIEPSWPELSAYAKQILGNGNRPLQAGERLVQKDYAQTLRLLAEEGPEPFYRGPYAQRIAQQVQADGGFLRAEDLHAYRPSWATTISTDYRGWRLVVPGPPCTSFDGLMKLKLMEPLDVAALGHNTVATLHHYLEFTKLTIAERIRYGGDPARYQVPTDWLLSPEHLAELATRISPEKAAPYRVIPEPPDAHTTHFAIVDPEGNVVSVTQTLGGAFGSKVCVEGMGMFINNIGFFFEYDPPGLRNDVGPGKQLASPVMPTLLFKNQQPAAAIGTPGGYGIIQTLPQIIMNLLDHQMNVQEAISAPRVRIYEEGTVGMEERIPAEVRDQLAGRGHPVKVLPAFTAEVGGSQGITIDLKNGQLAGGADPRRDGQAIGW